MWEEDSECSEEEVWFSASGEFTTVMEPGLTEGVAPSEATRIVPGLTEAEALGCAEVPSAS